MDAQLLPVLEAFQFDSPGIRSCTPYGNGNINHTFLVTCTGGDRYILQRISEGLTKDAAGLMENIARVTAHLREKEPDPRKVLSLVPAKEGGFLASGPAGNWRAYRFIEDTLCLQAPESEEDFRESARAFGRFEELLADFPAATLKETIVDFHNTPLRCARFHEALEKDAAGRRKEVEEEIEFLLKREEEMGILQRMRDSGELPVRVTHNDTKLNNVLFDAPTRKALCIIDLDAVMPGLSLYDFGDAIRYGASTAPEDEKDLSRVALSLPLYNAFREGFLEACSSLTPEEIRLLPLGAKVITLEQAVRFLTDYLEGDTYYHIQYPAHNLVRTRTQIRLAEDMERHWEEMGGI